MTGVLTLERRTVGPAEVETALLENYAGLVRLAYLVLPSALGRHRRVLAAHGVVQRALPDRRALERELAGATDATTVIRRHVLRSALRQASTRPPARLLPQVWGFRLFPASGAADDLVLDQTLAGLTPAARAAWALVRLEHLDVTEAEGELRAIGVAQPAAAVAEAATVDADLVNRSGSGHVETLVFDPCSVRLAPTDLMRRRARGRAVAIAVTFLLALAILASLLLSAGRDEPVRPVSTPQQVAPAVPRLTADAVRRTGATRWMDTARVDFTAWNPRGELVADQGLVQRALDSWTRGSDVVSVAGTSTSAPVDPPQLLFAGEVDGAAVVLLHDGRRLARYTDGGKLLVARTDDADVATAAAVAIGQSAAGVRFLTAPWVAAVSLRDLVKPDLPAKVVPQTNGITAPVPAPGPGCSSWPALHLQSSGAIAENHSFLLTYLGGLSPAHLTYLPPPSVGEAGLPGEATGGRALVTWSRTACALQSLQNKGVKAVDNWTFAEQRLPDGTVGNWVCTRADTWAGEGWAAVRLFPAGLAAGQAANTAICSRFDRNVLATTAWRSPTGDTYLLAAGSRGVDRLTVGGRQIPGSQVALLGRVTARVTGHVTSGATITPLNK